MAHPHPVNSVSFVNAQVGYGVGVPGDAGALLKTDNGGPPECSRIGETLCGDECRMHRAVVSSCLLAQDRPLYIRGLCCHGDTSL